MADVGFLAEVFNRHQLYLADMLIEAKTEPISFRMAHQRTLDHPEIHVHISVPLYMCVCVWVCVCVSVCVCVCMYVCIYIYIYILVAQGSGSGFRVLS